MILLWFGIIAILVIVAVTRLFASLFSKANRHIRILIFSAVAFFAGTLAGVPAVNYLAAIGGAALFAISIFSASKPAEKTAEEAGLSIESEEPRVESSCRSQMLKFSAIIIALGVFLLFAYSAGSELASVELSASPGAIRHLRANIELSEDGKLLRISPLDETGFEGLNRRERELALSASGYNRRGQRLHPRLHNFSWRIEGLASEEHYEEFEGFGSFWLDLSLHLTDEPRTLKFTVSNWNGSIYDTIIVIVDPYAPADETPQEASL